MEKETETIEITSKVLEALLNMTGGDVELHQPPKRRLVEALHKAKSMSNGRWVVTFTHEDLHTAYDHLRAYCLNRPAVEMRLMNSVAKQSEYFRQLRNEAMTARSKDS